MYSSRTARVDLAEEDFLEFVVEGQDTGRGNTTEDVGAGTLEERPRPLLGCDLASSVEHRLVVRGTARGHHHTTTDGVEGVGRETCAGGDAPAEKEGRDEVALEGTDEDDGLDGVVETEVETAVDDDTSDRGDEATVKTCDTVCSEGLAVDVDEAVELPSPALNGRLVVVRKTRTGVVEGVDEQERRGTCRTTRSNVTREPLPVSLRLFKAEHRLEVVLEREVEGLSGEVTNDIDSVTSPKRHEALVGIGAPEAVDYALVRGRQAALLKHLVLVLHEKLDSLDGGSRRLRDSGGYTAHEEVDDKRIGVLGLGIFGHVRDLWWLAGYRVKERFSSCKPRRRGKG